MEEVAEVVTNVPKEEKIEKTEPVASLKEYTPYTPLYDIFKATSSERTKEVFEKIWAWASKSSPTKDVDSIKWEVVKLKNRLGSPQIGEPSYARVERWVSANNDLTKAEERMREMEK